MTEGTKLGRLFGANLKSAREAVNFSQEEVGFRAGLHRTEIGMLERGDRLPRIDTLIRLSGAVGCKPGQLLRGLTWTPRKASEGGFAFEAHAEDEEQPNDDRG